MREMRDEREREREKERERNHMEAEQKNTQKTGRVHAQASRRDYHRSIGKISTKEKEKIVNIHISSQKRTMSERR